MYIIFDIDKNVLVGNINKNINNKNGNQIDL